MSKNNKNDVSRTDAAAENLNQIGQQPAQSAQQQPAQPAAQTGLNKLYSTGTKKAAKAPAKNEWEIDLTPEAEELANRWVGAKALLEPVKTREENSKAEFSAYAVRKVVERIFSTKGKVSNPRVHLRQNGRPDHNFLFMFQNRFQIQLPAVLPDQDQREVYVQTFVDAGLHPQSASNLVDNELDFTPQISIRSPKELMVGHYGEKREFVPATSEEQALGQKLLNLLFWDGSGETPAAFTDEERANLIVNEDSVKVKAGFLDRVAGYCQTVDQLSAVFKIIKPTAYPTHWHFATSDSDETRLERKLDVCREIVGSWKKDNNESAD